MGPIVKAVPLAVALAAAFLCNSAKATSVIYTEGMNEGTKETSAPFSVVTVPGVYGTHDITQNGDTWVITFHPTSNFSVNAFSGQNVVLDGALKFDLAFSGAINLFSIAISEGGTWGVNGQGSKSVFAGGTVSETDTIGESLSKSNAAATFVGTTNGTWTDTVDFGGFNGVYSNYHFSFDNILTVDSLANQEGNAYLAKGDFTVTINVPSAQFNSTATPLPKAAWGGLALCGAVLAASRLRRVKLA